MFNLLKSQVLSSNQEAVCLSRMRSNFRATCAAVSAPTFIIVIVTSSSTVAPRKLFRFVLWSIISLRMGFDGNSECILSLLHLISLLLQASQFCVSDIPVFVLLVQIHVVFTYLRSLYLKFIIIEM
jgi:hypothetical protein